MKISILGIVLGLLLLVIPLYIIYYFKLRIMRRMLVAFGRMCVGVAVIALVVFGALKLNSIVYDVVMALLLALTSSILSLGKARLSVSKLLIPIGIGNVVALAFIGFYFIFLVMGEKNPFLPNIFIPMFGLVAGGMITANAKALQTYYSGLLHHGQLYDYIIGNGGTHSEAIRHFVRRGLQASIVTVSKQMSRIVFATAPVIMLAMVMVGSDILSAAVLQIMFYVAVMAASMVSLLLALLIGRKYSFDEYERLRPVFKAEKPSDSSSSHEELPHTDSESQPQEE